MPVELKIPSVGDSITEVQIGKWLKKEGDFAKVDEIVVELETDKAAVEVPSPISGKITRLLHKPGDIVKVGAVVAHLEEAAAPAVVARPASAPAPAATAAPAAKSAGGETRVMPAAQRMLAESGVAASAVAPTGPGGRLLKEDVINHLDKAPVAASSTSVAVSDHGARVEEVVPMTMIRRRIAERLVSAQHTMAILTTFNEIDMSAVMELRKQFQDQFTKQHGVKLGFSSFFVKAVVDALKLYPAINAEIRGTDVIYRNYYDVGVAIGGGKGLVVPIIRSAERLSFADIEKRIGEFAKKAADNKLTVEEMTGGTFSITNGGVYGSLLSTPIINPPQSGILGMHAIQDRPVAINGQVVIRPMMYVALSYDHRIVDGREAVSFLKRIKDVIENPARMLMEV
jgi:2-oxoglutarate dehydrogenase E2 component (dihydrolipoamide succinyltransferase)